MFNCLVGIMKGIQGQSVSNGPAILWHVFLHLILFGIEMFFMLLKKLNQASGKPLRRLKIGIPKNGYFDRQHDDNPLDFRAT
jgi:hypothetical protein